jgi:hypothetical protein
VTSSAGLLALKDVPWTILAEGARQKLAESGGKRVRLLELTQAFVDEEWCTRGHVGYVLEGQLELAFEDRVEQFAKGSGFVLRDGDRYKHKARALGRRVLVLLTEDL